MFEEIYGYVYTKFSQCLGRDSPEHPNHSLPNLRRWRAAGEEHILETSLSGHTKGMVRVDKHMATLGCLGHPNFWQQLLQKSHFTNCIRVSVHIGSVLLLNNINSACWLPSSSKSLLLAGDAMLFCCKCGHTWFWSRIHNYPGQGRLSYTKGRIVLGETHYLQCPPLPLGSGKYLYPLLIILYLFS